MAAGAVHTAGARLRAVDSRDRLALLVGFVASVIVVVSPTPERAVIVVAAAAAVAAAHRAVLGWRGLITILILCTMLVPARRYALPFALGLPYKLEPYRLAVALCLAAVFLTRCADRSFRLRRLHGTDVFIGVIATAMFSDLGHAARIVRVGLTSDVFGEWLHLATLLAVFALFTWVVTSRASCVSALAVLVAAGAGVGLLAMIENRTGYNPFVHLDNALPLADVGRPLKDALIERGRAYGSAQHPLALSVVSALLLPLVPFLAVHANWPRGRAGRIAFWSLCGALLTGALVASISRTGIVALSAAVIVAVRLRPRMLPAAALSGIIVVALTLALLPAAWSSLTTAFRPEEGLVAEQSTNPGGRHSGRLADIGPAMDRIYHRPVFGEGFATRSSESRDAFIFDNGYLSHAIETGIPGLVALLALLIVPGRRVRQAVRSCRLERWQEDLGVALAASFAGYAVAFAFFDGFSYIQPMVVYLALLAVSVQFVVRPSYASPE